MAGVLSTAEFELFERLVTAVESIAASVEVRLGGLTYPFVEQLSKPPTFTYTITTPAAKPKRKRR